MSTSTTAAPASARTATAPIPHKPARIESLHPDGSVCVHRLTSTGKAKEGGCAGREKYRSQCSCGWQRTSHVEAALEYVRDEHLRAAPGGQADVHDCSAPAPCHADGSQCIHVHRDGRPINPNCSGRASWSGVCSCGSALEGPTQEAAEEVRRLHLALAEADAAAEVDAGGPAVQGLPDIATCGTAEVLTEAERDQLAAYEQVIDRGLKTFFEVGLALADIQARRLYRQTHEKFADYCQQVWGISDSRARQLIGATNVVTAVTAAGLPAPATEAAARELGRVLRETPAALEEVHAAAVEVSGSGKPTAAAYRQAREELTAPAAPALTAGPDPEESPGQTTVYDHLPAAPAQPADDPYTWVEPGAVVAAPADLQEEPAAADPQDVAQRFEDAAWKLTDCATALEAIAQNVASASLQDCGDSAFTVLEALTLVTATLARVGLVGEGQELDPHWVRTVRTAIDQLTAAAGIDLLPEEGTR